MLNAAAPRPAGSLVLLLPVYHTGGALSVDHGGESKRFDWATTAARDLSYQSYAYGADREAKIAAHTPSATLRYAAFFGDATHRVKPVADGARVTLAYELYRDGLPDPAADALLLRAERCRAAFASLARSPSFMAEGGHLGFECCHLYEEKELTAAEKTLAASSAGTASARKIKGLKNEDAVLGVAAAAAGLCVESVRILSDGNGYSECEYLLDKMPSSARGFGSVRNCDGCRMKGISPDEVDDYAAGRLDESYPGLEWVSKRQGAKRELAELEFGEYFGNEASTTTFYTRACLVVTVPPAGTVSRLAISSSDALTTERVHADAAAPKPATAKSAAAPKAAASKAATTPAPGASSSTTLDKFLSSTSTPAAPAAAAATGAAAGKKRARAVEAADDDGDEEEEVVRPGAAKLKTRSVSVTLHRIQGSLGIALADNNQITAVHAGGAGAKAGLAVGDAVTEVNGKSVHLASFGSLLPKDKAAPIKMRLQRVVEADVGTATAADGKTPAGGKAPASSKTAGKAKVVSRAAALEEEEEDDDDDDDDDDSDEESEGDDEEPPAKKPAPPRPAGAAGSSSSSAPSAFAALQAGAAAAAAAAAAAPSAASAPKPPPKASAPPALFSSTPSASTAGPRTIHIVGAQGSATRMAATGGKASIVLQPGEGLRELKAAIRKCFGLYKHHKLSKLMLAPPAGGAEAEAKKNDLVHGATVRCTYTFSSGNGNIGGFGPGGRRRGGFRGGGFGGMSQRDMMMLMLLQGRGGFGGYGGYGSDDSY